MNYQIEQIPYYLTWKIRHTVMYPELTIEDVKLPADPEGLHFGLYSDNKLISIVSLFEQGEKIQLRKFATLADQQGKGFGKLLLKYVLDFAQKTEAETIWCNARISAAGFYEAFGFYKTAKTYTADGHDFVIMERSLKKEEHTQPKA